MVEWLQASALLLLASVSARTVCSFTAGWLVYLLYARPHVVNERRRARPPAGGDLKVIACGLSRTGTLSLCEALETLGFPCLHAKYMCQPTRAKLFMKAYSSGRPKDWRKYLEGFTAVADYPAASSYKELLALYPNAKVILTTRDANKWYDSFSQTVMREILGHDYRVFKIVPTYNTQCATMSMNKKFFDGKLEDREVCIKAFLKHIQDVKAHVSPPNLLVYDIEKEEGWSTLCSFLNVPIPSEPFPKSNSRSNIKGVLDTVGRFYTWVFATYVIILACAFRSIV